MSEQVTVYTLPNCMQCTLTKRALTEAGVPFQVVDLTTDAQALELLKDLGYRSAPVVINGDNHWSRFRPDKIAATAAVHSRSQDADS